MALDGIEFASYIFSNKAREVDYINEQAHLSVIYAQCAESLKEISVKSSGRLDWHCGFAQVLQQGASSKLHRACIDYTNLSLNVRLCFITCDSLTNVFFLCNMIKFYNSRFVQVGTTKLINRLRVTLQEIASKAEPNS